MYRETKLENFRPWDYISRKTRSNGKLDLKGVLVTWPFLKTSNWSVPTVCGISVQPGEKESFRESEKEGERRKGVSREVSMNLLTLIANSPSFSISRSFLPLFSFSPFTFFATVLSLSLTLVPFLFFLPLFTGVRARESPWCKRKITPLAVFPGHSRRRARRLFIFPRSKNLNEPRNAQPFEPVLSGNYYGSNPYDFDRKSPKISLDSGKRERERVEIGLVVVSPTTTRLIARITPRRESRGNVVLTTLILNALI